MASKIDLGFILKLALITTISWLPPFVFKKIMKRIDPSDYEKVMMYKKTDRINYRIR